MLKRLIQGFGANFLTQILNLASRVLLVPLFLAAWGTNVYGEWLLLTSIVAYLSLTDMGGQLYIINRLTQAYAQRDLPLFRKILHTGFSLFLIIPLTVFVIFVVVIFFFPLGSLLQITITSRQVVFLVLAVLAFQFVFSLPQGILLGIYRAVGLLPRGAMLINAMLAVTIALVALGLWLRAGLVAIACLQLLPCLGVTLVAGRDLNRRFPQFQLFSLRQADLFFGLTFIKPSLQFFLIMLAQACSIQGMVVIVGLVLGSAQLVVYATLRTIVYSIRHVLGLLAHTAWPEMTRLDAEDNSASLVILFRGILRSTLVAATFLVIVFHFFGGTIYHAWLGDKVAYSQQVMDLLLLYMLPLIVWTCCGNLLMAVNRHHAYSPVVFASSLLAIGLAYVGGRDYGLPGVVMGLIIGEGLVPLCIVPYLLYRYQVQFSANFFIKELAPVAVALGSIALFHLLTIPVLALLLVWWGRCWPRHGLAWRR